jgi:hypothetical protein
MKKKLFLSGILGVALVFAIVVIGCDNDDDGGGSNFDGTTLVGTKWTVTQNVPYDAELSMDVKVTLEFSSNTAGTATVEVTDWYGNWDEAIKAYINATIAQGNVAFTYTYDAASKTGAFTGESGPTGTCTVDVGKKELTTTETDEEGETGTVIYKLQ